MSNRLRAGDADRDRAARLLGVHFAAGRLTQDEFCDRLAAALAAVTFFDLGEIVADLPGGPAMVRPQASPLERRYRRLLALYPARYRRVHEDEMLAILLTGAPEGKVRPSLRETADLLGACPRVWWQSLTRPGLRGVAVLMSAGAVAGILGGIAVAAATPPAPVSAALVQVPSNPPAPPNVHLTPAVQSDIFVLTATEVLTRAAWALHLPSWKDLWHRVHAVPLNANVIQITVSAPTGIQAEQAANAVAHAWLTYPAAPHSELLAPATIAYRPSALASIIDSGAIGALCGAILGVLIGMALAWKRLRLLGGPA
jgi:Domain of unknown function (DUF1707)